MKANIEEANAAWPRTKDFVLTIIRLYASLRNASRALLPVKQLPRSGACADVQHRAGQHAKSDADFISRAQGGRHELDETAYRRELLAAQLRDSYRRVS